MRHSFATGKCPALLDGHGCRGTPKFRDILATTGATQAASLLCGSQHECWVGPYRDAVCIIVGGATFTGYNVALGYPDWHQRLIHEG